MEDKKEESKAPEEKKEFNFKKHTNKEFKSFFKGQLIWNGKLQGTMDLGINKRKRAKKLGIK
jgi:hypothetical protein